MLSGLAYVLQVNHRRSRLARQLGRDFQRVERLARVTPRLRHQLIQRVLGQGQIEGAQPALGICQGALNQDTQIGFRQRVEYQHLGARQQRANYLEGGILGGGADQG